MGARPQPMGGPRLSTRPRVALVAALVAAACASPPSRRVALATTTSVDNSGLLRVLVPAFRRETGIELQVATVGSGIALDMLKRGDVDAAVSHAPAREAGLLRNGRAWIYRKIMFNDFVLVGPPDDPARVRGAGTVEGAMRRIAASGSRFISRGDSSGTHERERDLWRRAGVPAGGAPVVVAGGGMGATLRIAGTTAAYTLSDRATFLQHADRGDLVVVFEGGDLLLNTYAVVIPPDATAEARRFADWIADGPGRALVRGYTVRGGAPAFHVWPPGCPRDRPEAQPCSGHKGTKVRPRRHEGARRLALYALERSR